MAPRTTRHESVVHLHHRHAPVVGLQGGLGLEGLVFERTLTECPEAYASKDESEDEHEDGGGSNDKGPDEGMLAGFIHPLRHPRQARSSPRCRRALMLADESNRFPGSDGRRRQATDRREGYSSTSVCDIGSR